ncbi:MAG: transposase [Cyanothece sp. SIO1E1]|nr:transposase [Cyanothece sp. SIO1E1]
MGRSRYRILSSEPHFLTCTTINWIPIFSKPELAQICLDSLAFLQKQQRLTLHSYVIMENHLHLIAAATDLAKEIRNFKSFTARSIIDWLQNNQRGYWLNQLKVAKLRHKTHQQHQLWQEGSHPQAILGADMLIQKLEYIHQNPVKRGYVDDPLHWRYSSYRNYVGQAGILPVSLIEV